MYKIELSISTAMSLHAMSSAGSEVVEEDEVIEEGEDDSALSMSDEDFEKMSEEEFAKLDEDADDKDDDKDEEDEDEDENPDDDDLGDDDKEDSDEEANDDEDTDTADEGGSEQADEEDDTEGKQPTEEELTANAKQYEETYNLLFGTPIKASGREVNLRDVNQARNLIEMGVDYNKKMQHMRPYMQTLKTLEKQGLLENEEKLNLLLEAQQGKPEAIRRLLTDANIDLMDLADEPEGEKYVPENHIVSQNEVDIDHALQSISASPAYKETIDVMSQSFDPKSREIISENPSYIQALNRDIESGLYGKVMDSVQYRRDTKAIPDTVSDIEAYIDTVRLMAENETAANAVNTPAAQQVEKKVSKPASSKRRKVGMSSNRSSNKKSKREYDPMEIMTMSDDEFEKKFGSELI